MIKVSAFRWVPPFAQGLVRDLRVRWALEEAGMSYEEHLLAPGEKNSDGYLRRQPFAQVPAYIEGDLELFESGAIVMHIAERSEALMPSDPRGRARTQTWMFAALNSVEPPITFLNEIEDLGDPTPKQREAAIGATLLRLNGLAKWMNGSDYLEDRFTAADLLMTTVLRNLRDTDLVERVPGLKAYQLRCEDRPAFKKALAAQMAVFEANAPPNA